MWPWLPERVVVVHIPRVYLLSYSTFSGGERGVWRRGWWGEGGGEGEGREGGSEGVGGEGGGEGGGSDGGAKGGGGDGGGREAQSPRTGLHYG